VKEVIFHGEDNDPNEIDQLFTSVNYDQKGRIGF